MVAGSLGTVRDPSTYWMQMETSSLGPIKMRKSSGERTPVTAWRCESCGRVELVAEAP